MLLHFKRESHAPFYATALLLVLNQLFSKETRWTLATISKFLEVNGRTFVELVGILAGCGLLIGAFSMTGVVSSLANDLLRIAGDNAFLLLGMCAFTSLILGLGLTTTACYIFLAILVAPALEKLGLNRMAVHMFIFYWGMLSSITPPVAIASFAAAGIAGSPAMKTGWESMWVGSIIYFIPFFFVLNPALVLQGAKPLSRRARADGAGGFRHAVHLRRHSGLSGLCRRPPPRRRAGMAAAGAAGDRRLCGGDARRRHHAAVADADHVARPRHSRSHGPGRVAADPPPNSGAEPVARAVIARQNGGDESIAHRRPGLDQFETALAAVSRTPVMRITSPETSGAVADYIPELGKADPAHFGISLATLDGHVYEVGDTKVPFTIQSMSKPFVFALALDTLGAARVESAIGVEPSGDPFNSIRLNAENHPFNPMVNAGAIACSGLIHEAKGDGAFEYIRAGARPVCRARARRRRRRLFVREPDRRPQPRDRLSAAHQRRASRTMSARCWRSISGNARSWSPRATSP